MMSLALLAAVVVGLVADSTTEPTKCCFHNQYTATLGEMGGQVYPITGNTVFLDGSIQLARDYNRKREGTIVSLRQPDDTYKSVATLKDYTNRVVHSRDYPNGTCLTHPLPVWDQMFPSCVPEDATFIGTSVFGYGPISLNVNTWHFVAPRGDNGQSVEVTMAVTRDHCIPFAETLSGTFGGVNTALALFYTNYNPGLADGTALDTPADCPPLPPIDVIGR